MSDILRDPKLRDVTEVFRQYRELARLLWNIGMRRHPDSSREFSELDPALFRALFTSYISRDEAREVGPNLAKAYPQVRVRLSQDVVPSHLAQFDGKWSAVGGRLGPGTFAYAGMFDFDWDADAYRDFQYVRCLIDTGDFGELLQEGTIILLEARNVEVFADSTLRPY